MMKCMSNRLIMYNGIKTIKIQICLFSVEGNRVYTTIHLYDLIAYPITFDAT